MTLSARVGRPGCLRRQARNHTQTHRRYDQQASARTSGMSASQRRRPLGAASAARVPPPESTSLQVAIVRYRGAERFGAASRSRAEPMLGANRRRRAMLRYEKATSPIQARVQVGCSSSHALFGYLCLPRPLEPAQARVRCLAGRSLSRLPASAVDKPRGTGLARTGVSPRAIR